MNAAELGWSDFAVAISGGTAALAGLIIVAMSVNISRIMKSPSIPARGASAIASLTAAGTCSCLLLIPGQPVAVFGLEVAAAAVVQVVLWIVLLKDVVHDRGPGRPVVMRAGVAALAPALFTVAAVVLITGSPAGLGWLAAASVIAIIAGVVFAWIALVEILR